MKLEVESQQPLQESSVAGARRMAWRMVLESAFRRLSVRGWPLRLAATVALMAGSGS